MTTSRDKKVRVVRDFDRQFRALDANGAVLIAVGANRLQSLTICITTGGGFLQIHDKGDLPPATANIIVSAVPVPATPSVITLDWSDEGGLDFELGIVICLSTTEATYTAPVGYAGHVTAFSTPLRAL